jgi:hypothetical protein
VGPVTAGGPKCLRKAIENVSVQGREVSALLDSGSSHSFIHPQLRDELSLNIIPDKDPVTLADNSTARSNGHCVVDVVVGEREYPAQKLSIMNNLCVDVILGLDWQARHKSLTFKFNGPEPPIEVCSSEPEPSVCGLTQMHTEPARLFANLTPDCKPIAAKSRRYSMQDRKFIKSKIQSFLQAGIIEPSNSPWRAQPVVTKDPNDIHRKRMTVDFSETINKFTLLDAYPLPRIDEQVNEISKLKYYSTIDFESAYYQILIPEEDRPYTAFEADGALWQFKVVPNGVTNGAAVFQRKMDEMVKNEKLDDTFPYLDNITVGGLTEEEHHRNYERLQAAVKKYNLTANPKKEVYFVKSLAVLGNLISQGEVRPDPERLRPLKELPIPHTTKALKRAVGMFSYYSKWIPNFSEKITPLKQSGFPLNDAAVQAFNQLKLDIEHSVVCTIDESLPFEVETDASDNALAGVLNQGGRPVAFFSKSLHGSELSHPPVEKEACAIIESVRHWKHFLLGHHFTLVTDQRSVAYMFDQTHKGRIKNDKIYRWRLDLACYSFDIRYRPGEENVSADTFSRVYCSAVSTDTLVELHDSLCHPGVTRMYAFVRSRNLPFSVDDVKKITSSCQVCQLCKPQFYNPPVAHLIKATQPFERLNIDFKGPVPSESQNQYMLTVVDEFSRFPFAFPCRDVSTKTVISCMDQLFSIFGMPSYVHSDRGTAFMSKELRGYLHGRGIATSRTTPYNPQGNGQCERYNGIVWRTIQLALKSRKLPTSAWESVLPDALHSIRSLLCTSTNATPHERLFNYQRRSTSGTSVPSWLSTPGPVLLKKHVRNSKYDSLVDEAELIEANPQYAHVRLQDGREKTVSLRDLAPYSPVPSEEDLPVEPPVEAPAETPATHPIESQPVRRSTRTSVPPSRLINEM